jgi:hypothetical protein
MCDAKCVEGSALGELGEIIGEGTANLSREEFVHGRNGTARLIQRDTFDAIHWKKDSRQPDALAVRLVNLPDKMVERVQINATQRDARRINVQKLAPNLFLGRVQTHNNNGMGIHNLGANSVRLQSTGIAAGWGTSCRNSRHAPASARRGTLLRLPRRGIAEVQKHQYKAGHNRKPC